MSIYTEHIETSSWDYKHTNEENGEDEGGCFKEDIDTDTHVKLRSLR
jgi:hypothetical protein